MNQPSGVPRNRHWHILGACTLVALVALAAAVSYGGASQEDEPFGLPISPELRSLEVLIESNGRLSARSTVTVGSEISGEISTVAVDFNDPVSEGQVVAEINPSRYLAQVRSAQASLDAARSRLARAHSSRSQIASELARAEKLFGLQLIAQSDVEQSRDRADEASSRRREAVADVSRLEAVVETAQYELEQTVIRSPVNGVVLERLVEPGQTVAASFATPALFRIAEDLSEMVIELSVDEADIGAIKPGQQVVFGVDSYPAREFFGTIVQKRVAPSIRGNNATYPVIVAVRNAEKLLIPGMLADARVTVDRRDEILTVPSEYILRQEDVASDPSPEVLMTALKALAGGLSLTDVELATFKSVAASIDLSQVSTPQAPDPELVKFFGAGAAANILVLDDASGDPLVALRRQRLSSLVAAFEDFGSTLSLEQSARLDQAFSDLVGSRNAEIFVAADGAVKKVPILVGLSDETATQIVYGLAHTDKIVSKEVSGL